MSERLFISRPRRRGVGPRKAGGCFGTARSAPGFVAPPRMGQGGAAPRGSEV
jgi:hypothetical protein